MRNILLPLPFLLAACELGLTQQGWEVDPPDDSGGDDNPFDSDEPEDSRQPDPGDQPPVADAGADQSAMVGDVVHLDGNDSYDPEGEELSFAWELDSLPSGSGVTIVNPTFAEPMFIPDVAGQYIVRLVVDDGAQASPPDTVQITAQGLGSEPVANAGPNQSVEPGDTVRLDGSNSYDPDGDPLSYAWSFRRLPSGSGAAISNPSSVSPSFVADLAGTYEVQLVVSDGVTSSDPDSASITASTDSGGDDCGFGCAREAEIALKRRLGSTAMVVFPLFFGWRWRRREDEPDDPLR
jgi:chitodextrinase